MKKLRERRVKSMKRSKGSKGQQRVKSKKISIRRFVKLFPPCLLAVVMALPATAAEQPREKLAAGIESTATGWTEVPKEIADTTEDKNVVEGVTAGAVKGAANAIENTAKGAVEAATFYMTDEDKEHEYNEYMDEHIDGELNKDIDEEMAEIHEIDEQEY